MKLVRLITLYSFMASMVIIGAVLPFIFTPIFIIIAVAAAIWEGGR